MTERSWALGQTAREQPAQTQKERYGRHKGTLCHTLTHINTSQPKSPVTEWSRTSPAPLCPSTSLLFEELCCALGRGGGLEAHRKCCNADGRRATCLHGPIKQAFREGTAAVPTHIHTHRDTHTIQILNTGLLRTPGLCKPRLFPEWQGWRVIGDSRSCSSLTRT